MSRQLSGGSPALPSRPTSGIGDSSHPGPPLRRSDRIGTEGKEGKTYALSVMADLHRSYLTDSDDDYSIFHRANSYRGKTEIDKRDIVDHGYSASNPERRRFALRATPYDNLSLILDQMQTSLDTARDILGEEGSRYVLDPQNLMLPVLQGTQSLFELDRAWKVLVARLARAQDKFNKYVAQYKGEEVTASPTPTNEEVYRSLTAEGNTSLDMNGVFDKLYRGVPSLNAQLSNEAREALNSGNSLHSALLSPVYLKDAFPHREVEQRPSDLIYDSDGGNFVGRTINLDSDTTNAGASTSRRATFAEPIVEARNSNYYSQGISDSISNAFRPQDGAISTPVDVEEEPYSSRTTQRPQRDSPPHSRELLHGIASAVVPRGRDHQPSLNSMFNRGDQNRLPYRSNWTSYVFNHGQGPPSSPSSQDSDIPSEGQTPHRNDNPGPRRPYPERYDQQPPNEGGGGGSGGGGGGGDGNPPRGYNRYPGRFPSAGGNPGGPGGPSGGGNPGGGGGPPGGGYPGPGAPYQSNGNNWNYNPQPSIKIELKPEQLPRWDGDWDTAVQYFFEIQEIAALGGNIPRHMGFWLWKNLETGSAVANWYANLTANVKDHMRSHFTHFVSVIQQYFLGQEWQQYIQLKYEQQRFRQRGHDQETPHQFIMRRILYTQMLLQVPPDSREEVYYITSKNPVSWASLLLRDSIRDTATLQLRARELESALIDAWSRSSGAPSKVITQENLLSHLQRVGVQTNASASSGPRRFRSYNSSRGGSNVTANLVETAEELNTSDFQEELQMEDLPNDDTIIHQAFSTMKRQPPPSRRGPFPFSKCDHVSTTLGKRPTWPCRACGSQNHWDKECPMYDRFLQQVKSAKWVAKEDVEEDDHIYTQVYRALVVNIDDSACVGSDDIVKESLRVEIQPEQLPESPKPNSPLTSSYLGTVIVNEGFSSVIEDVEDEAESARKNKAESMEGETYDMEPSSDALPHQAYTNSARQEDIAVKKPLEKEGPHQEAPGREQDTERTAEEILFSSYSASCDYPAPEPPREESVPIKVPKHKRTAPGQAALGTSVLSMQGRIGSLTEALIDLRLDSGADVSLVSKDYLETLKCKIPIRQGIKMKLWQLTDKNACLEGYVNLPLYVESVDGSILQTEIEAYVVPDMSVDILLGEDYQQAYEMTIKRSLEDGTRVSYRHSPAEIKATAVGRTKDFERLHHTHFSQASYVRAKEHRRSQARRQRKRRKFGEEKRTIRAAEDALISPNSVVSLKVEGYFEEDKDWLVEKSLLANADDSFFAVPNILFSSTYPVIPIMNPTEQPRYVRKGEAVGRITDPEGYLDTPTSLEHWMAMENRAQSTATLLSELWDLESAGSKEGTEKTANTTETIPATMEDTKETLKPRTERNETAALLAGLPPESENVDSESWGPKTAEMPDPTVYSSADMEKLLDVGSLPEELKQQAWEMLRRRVGAFGFDGRLGHHPSKVHIRTVDGQCPISVPMYNSSPAKKAVIEEQLKTWFELGVIEPSKSPWSAPVVIAYRNGKARFCVDYRKLNAVTIPDEFPIPRQSEILSALSGAQVLSCLDALSGFTQLEFEDSEVEKTAFRTHMGLFQF